MDGRMPSIGDTAFEILAFLKRRDDAGDDRAWDIAVLGKRLGLDDFNLRHALSELEREQFIAVTYHRQPGGTVVRITERGIVHAISALGAGRSGGAIGRVVPDGHLVETTGWIVSDTADALPAAAAVKVVAAPGARVPGTGAAPSKSDVFIIHGRNLAARNAIASFLRVLGLTPLDFDTISAELGGSPFIGDVVRRGIERAHGVLAVFTPDEHAMLLPAFHAPADRPDERERFQARPNVIFEAGMALGFAPDRTILITLGTDVSLFSDVDGRHVLRLDNSAQKRDLLQRKLAGIGCPVVTHPGWLEPDRAGDFDSSVRRAVAAPPRAASTAAAPAEAVSDAAAKIKIKGWLRGVDRSSAGHALSCDTIDSNCALPRGTAARLLSECIPESWNLEDFADGIFSLRLKPERIVVGVDREGGADEDGE
jgi:predicted nucleotide-binding protein